MKKAARAIKRFFHPPMWVLITVPLVSFAALIALFMLDAEEGASAYCIYTASAYSLSILIAALPKFIMRLRRAVKGSKLVGRVSSSKVGSAYRNDASFRAFVAISRSMAVDMCYAAFRAAMGIWYASIWSVSIAVYHIVLGCLRLNLAAVCRRTDRSAHIACYRRTAWLLFVLNIPMGCMVAQMVYQNASFSYPGHIIYASALYAFYALIAAIRGFVKYNKLESPVQSAAKALNLVAAMMSVLGLQTAMLTTFYSGDNAYRFTMNTITGGAVLCAVAAIAAYMLFKAKRFDREKGSKE